MTLSPHGRTRPWRHPGPMRRGRTVLPVTITLDSEEHAALATLAHAQKVSVTTVARRLITAGLVEAGVRWRAMGPAWRRTLPGRRPVGTLSDEPGGSTVRQAIAVWAIAAVIFLIILGIVTYAR